MDIPETSSPREPSPIERGKSHGAGTGGSATSVQVRIEKAHPLAGSVDRANVPRLYETRTCNFSVLIGVWTNRRLQTEASQTRIRPGACAARRGETGRLGDQGMTGIFVQPSYFLPRRKAYIRFICVLAPYLAIVFGFCPQTVSNLSRPSKRETRLVRICV